MAELVYADLGRASYDSVLDLQMRLVEEACRCEEELARLLLVEHDPPVITLGRGAERRHVLADPEVLTAEGIELRKSSRGGDVTYHGPGQLVAYPILRLDLHGRDVHGYLRDLEEVLISVLERFGIKADRCEGYTGVWVDDRKIAAIGVAVRRWVSYHGLALNVDLDLSRFNLIVPCGIRGRGVTSMSRVLKDAVSVSQVKGVLLECILERFGFDRILELPPEELAARYG